MDPNILNIDMWHIVVVLQGQS